MRLTTSLFALMIVSAQCFGCQSPSKEPATPRTAPTATTAHDEHVTLTVDMIIKAETLPAEILKQMGLRADQVKKPADGKQYVAISVSFRRIKGVYITGPVLSTLYDGQGDQYRSDVATVRGLKFWDIHDAEGPRSVEEGAVEVLLFQVPKDRTPASLTFSYRFKEGWDEVSAEKWNKLQTKTANFAIDLKQVHLARTK